jgi:glycerophosphoryl diester phosphodiesterase
MTRSMNKNIFYFLTLALLTGCATQPNSVDLQTVLNRDRTEQDSIRCTVGAHRGDSLMYTENSPQAILSALDNPKYAFIEFDVQYSADEIPVVFHDGSLHRIFGHKARVEELTAAELRTLSRNEIATYDEIMDMAKGKPLNIEVKSQGDEEADQRLIDYIVNDVRERGIDDRILISSISAAAVKYVNSQYPEFPTGQIFWLKASTYLPFDFLTAGLYEEIGESEADYVMLHTANRRNIRDLLRMKPEGKTLVFWDFGDTMYIVHKDPSDRLWSESRIRSGEPLTALN